MSQLDLVWRGHAGDESPDPESSSTGLRLVTPIRESTWLGRDPDGRSVTARRLADLSDPAGGDDAIGGGDPSGRAAQEPAVVIERAAMLASVRASSLVPALGVRHVNGELWLVSELDDGVWLSRLLELIRPRPAQAVVVGLGVLCALRTVHAAGYVHGSIGAGEVRIGGDGQVRLDGWATGALCRSTPCGSAPLEQGQRTDLAAVGTLLAHLACAARRSPACADEDAPALLAALDAAADHAAHPGAVIELVATMLEAVCGPDDEAAARSELAALVRAAAVGGSASGTARCSRSVASGESAPGALPEPGWAARRVAWIRGVWQRSWRWVVALVVLVAVVLLEFALLHDRLAQDLRLLLGSSQPGQGAAAPVGATPVELPPVSRPAPASAGAVGGVDLRSLESCSPGSECAVRVLIQLHPQPEPADRQPPLPPRAVEWAFQVVDRCTGTRRNVAGGAVSVAPGEEYVQAVSTVPLPPGDAFAVIAVTSEPAKVASGALLVPARPGSCLGN